MKWFNWLSSFSTEQKLDQKPDDVSIGVETAPLPRCPYPLSSDNGTASDCLAKRHCMCAERDK